MSDVLELVDDILEHHGTKGMKWGVRKDKGHEGQSAKTKKIDKLDKKFERNASNINTTIKIYNAAAQRTNDHDIARINNKPQYKNADFRRDSPLRRKYYAEHQKALLDNLEKAANDLGTNASGTKRYTIEESSNGDWRVSLQDVKHADDSTWWIKVNKDAGGRITSLELRDPMMHSDLLDEFLEHHGVKGQKWGQRKKAAGVKSSSDFKKTSEIRKKKPHQLTNKQLQNANARANLERNFKNLNPTKVEKGHAAVKGMLAILGTAASIHTLATSPAGRAAISAGKDFFKSVKVTVK